MRVFGAVATMSALCASYVYIQNRTRINITHNCKLKVTCCLLLHNLLLVGVQREKIGLVGWVYSIKSRVNRQTIKSNTHSHNNPYHRVRQSMSSQEREEETQTATQHGDSPSIAVVNDDFSALTRVPWSSSGRERASLQLYNLCFCASFINCKFLLSSFHVFLHGSVGRASGC